MEKKHPSLMIQKFVYSQLIIELVPELLKHLKNHEFSIYIYIVQLFLIGLLTNHAFKEIIDIIWRKGNRKRKIRPRGVGRHLHQSAYNANSSLGVYQK